MYAPTVTLEERSSHALSKLTDLTKRYALTATKQGDSSGNVSHSVTEASDQNPGKAIVYRRTFRRFLPSITDPIEYAAESVDK